ncbi:YihY/virulence factor BrkB family protein [Cellulosilyticum sp. I15G10I2]|uniref:YihY/virulence factor BrkB family protein n=1 Tax=Cellulosilyticum sp. I15G10I2 TaxID=1892843 RepID=UPI00085C232A|nr:YihY/virulence factor BrkB family protein [Cellulosilyticum sp. I15G10I2]
MNSNVVVFFKKLIKRYTAHNIAATSAQIAYYWIMAFFPFLIFIISLLTYTKIPAGILLEYIAKIVPASSVPFIQNTINQFIINRSTTLLSVGMLFTLWSGGTAVNALAGGIHLAYNSKPVKPFWLSRLTAVLYTILLAVLIIVLMVGLVFGNRLGDYIMESLHMNKGIFMPIWQLGRLIMPFLALIAILYIIYRIIPRKHLKCKNVWPGTVVVSLGWYFFSLIFSIYVDNYSKYNQLYGSIGGVFVLLIWLYSSCMLLLVGAEINSLYQELKTNHVIRKIERIRTT